MIKSFGGPEDEAVPRDWSEGKHDDKVEEKYEACKGSDLLGATLGDQIAPVERGL